MDMRNQIDRAKESFMDIDSFNRVKKAIEFKEAYKAEHNGKRPSLVAIIALWQEAEAKAADLQNEIEVLRGNI